MTFDYKKFTATIFLFFIFSCSQKVELMTNEGALTLNHDGINREYLLYIPEAYDTTLRIT